MAKAKYIQDIENTITDARRRLKKHRNLEWNEYKTRYYLLDPILRSLGWDLSDPAQVLVEDSAVNGDRPDYRFLGANANPSLMVVEAKRIFRSDIEYIFSSQAPDEDAYDYWIEYCEDDISQLRKYVSDLQTGYAVLSDGNAWCIWDLSKGNDLAQGSWSAYVWAFCEDLPYVSDTLKILCRRNLR